MLAFAGVRPACLLLDHADWETNSHGRRSGGLPDGAPERPQTPAGLSRRSMTCRPPRNTTVLTEEEKKRVEAELAVMREQQARRAQSSAANPN